MRRKLLVLAAGAVIIAALVMAGINRGLCAYTGWQLDRETRYAAFIGCMIRSGESWLPLR